MKTSASTRGLIAVLTLVLGMLGRSNAFAADTYVAHNGQAQGDYLSWETAASNIQDAVNAASEGATVWVGPGTYRVPPNATNLLGTNVVYINKALTLRSSNSVPETTIIDGQGAYRGITFYYDKTTPKRFTIDGFTIANCSATNEGGGVRIYYTAGYGTSVVQNCIISDNILGGTGYSWGGGVYAKRGSAPNFAFMVSNCVVRRNQATTSGAAYLGVAGGIYANYAEVRIVECTIDNNRAGLGGGVFLDSSCVAPLLLENCTIRSNLATKIPNANDSRSGGVELKQPGTMRNCLLVANQSETALSDQVRFHTPSPASYYMENCTVVHGVGIAGGAAVQLAASGVTAVFVNTIVCSNSLNLAAGSRVSIGIPSGGYAYVTNSFVIPLPTATRYNMTACFTDGDAGFKDFSGHDYHLALGSRCIDSGTNQLWMEGAKDLDGKPRKDTGSGLVDMGCYEFEFIPPGGTFIWLR